MSKELSNINNLKTVYICIRSISGKNSQLTDDLTMKILYKIKENRNTVETFWSSSTAFLPNIVEQAKENNYLPVLIGSGEDRYSSYKKMLDRMTNEDNISIHELKGRITSATNVRKSILENQYGTFCSLVPKEIYPFFQDLKKELQPIPICEVK